ncbi:MAG TPA: cellulase family glycosylhydrolase [Anaerolineaceae bacterium]
MRLYPENPHYIEFRGKPRLLIGSGEHYGAVLNTDFDYHIYLDELARCGLNQLRLFSGTYRELPGEFGIVENNLAPREEAFLCPWARTPEGKFDLAVWNPDYFARLHDFIRLAAMRGIAVELVLFCFWYNPSLWEYSPMHPANNVQGVGPLDKEKVYTLQDNDLLPVQDALVKKLVEELNGYDNVYFEVCNEPYSRHDHTMYLDWHHHMVDFIAAVESHLRNHHLIAINYQNRTQRIPSPNREVSICNFHYATPDAVKENYHLHKVIAYDETGFMGQLADPYRRDAWNFLLAGGGIFSHLDYSFTTAHPGGTAQITGNTPGYGGADLRGQLSFLRSFLEDLCIWDMRPYNEIFAWFAGRVPAQVMCEPGRVYLIYFSEGGMGINHLLSIPPGSYSLDWIDPIHRQVFLTNTADHDGGYLQVHLPGYLGDLVLKITKTA